MDDLQDLYQELILDHNKRPRNRRPLTNANHHADGFNPLCGDRVRIKGAGVDGELSFHDGLIDVSVKLGLLTSMFEPVLRREVQRYLDEHVT